MSLYNYPIPPSSELTPEATFMDRRKFLAGTTGLALAGFAGTAEAKGQAKLRELSFGKSPLSVPMAEATSFKDITQYNNFYEFGTSKTDPARHAGKLTTVPWSVKVDGLVNNPGQVDFEDLLTKFALEERIYRFRCVEAWSMVVPWVGFELADLLKRVGVQSSAKYVAFETLVRPEEMIGQKRPVLDWPYREGLRLDEAMHPLTLMATGLYDEPMPNQNGAPIRLVVPWKYGFKSIKSIVRITLTEKEPPISWNMANPREYGFYSNVNPTVDHPR